MGKVVKKALPIAAAVSTGGLSLALTNKKLKSKLFGKKDMGTPDRYNELDPSLRAVVEAARPQQEKAAGIYGKELDRLKGEDPAKIANLVATKKEKALRGQGEDAKREMASQIARRGMGKSAAGLSALVNADKASRDKISEIRGDMPLIRQKAARERLATIGQATGGINQILNAQGARRQFIQGRQGTGKRTGGIGNVLMTGAGAALGGYMGGPQGAGAGAQIGSSLGSMI